MGALVSTRTTRGSDYTAYGAITPRLSAHALYPGIPPPAASDPTVHVSKLPFLVWKGGGEGTGLTFQRFRGHRAHF